MAILPPSSSTPENCHLCTKNEILCTILHTTVIVNFFGKPDSSGILKEVRKIFLHGYMILPIKITIMKYWRIPGADSSGYSLKVSKSQMHFFLKLHCPKNERNIWQNSALWIFRSVSKNYFWDLLTFNKRLVHGGSSFDTIWSKAQ